MGLDYGAFWGLTPREIGPILKADGARVLRRFEDQRLLNSELANLIAFAFHQPADIPKYRPLEQERRDDQRREESTEAEDAYVRAFFIGLAKTGEAR